MGKEKLWRTVLTTAAAVLGSWLGLWLLGPVLLPFAVGYGFARLASPLTSGLQRRTRLPRWLCGGIGLLGIYGTLGLGLWLLCRVLCREAEGFLRTLPELAESMTEPMQRLKAWLMTQASRFPDGIGKALEEGVSGFFRNGAGLGGRLYNWLFSAASAILAAMPDLALFLLTALLSSFMLASKLPELDALWRRKLPVRWQTRLHSLGKTLKRTLGSWLTAQGKLMFITFLILTAGFLVLQIEYPLLFSTVITLLDALPVLGSGAVLIPWSLIRFLQGSTVHGVGLLCVYAAAALTRTALEPRLLGKQMGLDPLLTLLALYAGYRFLGVPGMILFPMGALIVKQFWDRTEKN